MSQSISTHEEDDADMFNAEGQLLPPSDFFSIFNFFQGTSPENTTIPGQIDYLSLLSPWQKNIKVGDIIDAQDCVKDWYPAIVKRIGKLPATEEYEKDDEANSCGEIHVHFLGWSGRYDEIIQPFARESRLKPLYTHTLDRSKWGKGDTIKVLIQKNHDIFTAWTLGIWIRARIVAVDLPRSNVLVEYDTAERDIALRNRFQYSTVVPPDKKDSVGEHDRDLKRAKVNTQEWFSILSDYIMPERRSDAYPRVSHHW